MASGKKFYKRHSFITLIIALLIAAVAVPKTLALTERQAKKIDVQVEAEEIEKTDSLVWGKEVNGLRAAVEFVPEKGSYEQGEVVGIRFHLQNVSNQTINLATPRWWIRSRCFAEDQLGMKMPTRTVPEPWGMTTIDRHKLLPGQVIKLESGSLAIAKDKTQRNSLCKYPVRNVVTLKTGRYSLYYWLRFPGLTRMDGDGKVIVPQPDDWQGALETGKRKLVLTSTAESDQKSTMQFEFEGKAGSVVQGKVLGPRGEPVKGATVELQIFVGGDVDDMANYRTQRVFTDANGLYVFEGLEAGSAHIGRAFTAADGSTTGVPYGLMFDFDIEPGKSYNISLGGKGRPVIGRLVPASGNDGDIDWSKAWTGLDLRAAPFSMGFWESSGKIYRAMIKDEGGDFYRKSPVKINPDGAFRIDNVRAGHYMLRVKISEEPKREGFNLFRDVRIPLMRDGTTETPLNLGALAVSHDNYIAPRHIDNKFLDKFELGRDIPVKLKAGTDEEPYVVSAKSIRLEKYGELVRAILKIEWKSIADNEWQATLRFQSENGSTLARGNAFFKTSKIIERYASLRNESLHFSIGPLPDLSVVKHFWLTIRPVKEQLISDAG